MRLLTTLKIIRFDQCKISFQHREFQGNILDSTTVTEKVRSIHIHWKTTVRYPDNLRIGVDFGSFHPKSV